MKTYTVTAWCDRTFTSRFEVEADTAEAALDLAKNQVHHEEAEECDDGYPWDTFSIDSDGGEQPLNWQDEHARLREAAPEILEALTSIVDADDGLSPELDHARRIIAKATGRAA